MREAIRGKLASTLLIVVILAPLLVAAVRAEGFRDTKIDLNDAGIWVVRTSSGLVGRINTQINTVEVSLAADSIEDFDVIQADSDVAIALPAAPSVPATIRTIDVATGTVGEGREVPAESDVQMGGPAGAILDRATGNLWITPRAELAAVDPAEAEPALKSGKDAVLAVGVDGVAHVFSPEDGRIRSAALDGDRGVIDVDVELEEPQLTTVGGEPILLDRAESMLVLPGGDRVDLADHGAAPVLQLPGPSTGSVVVATDDELLTVGLSDGSVEVLDDTGTRGAARPVWLGGCTFGAWSGAPRFAQICDGRDPIVDDIGSMTPGNPLRFRVNRNRVVLNETTTGNNLLFTEDEPVEITDWSQAEDNEDDEDQPTPEVDDEQRACDREIESPQLVADEAGTRSGRPVVIDVLANDRVDECDVPIVEIATAPDPAQATVSVVEGGAAVQVVPAPDLEGSVQFTYGLRTPAGDLKEESVAVTLRDPTANEAPTANPDETSVSVGRTTRHNVLANDTDPDGDALTLVSVTPVEGGAAGTVNFRSDGEISFRASGTAGTAVLAYVVQDERGEAAPEEGTLEIAVADAENLRPIARDDRVLAQVGEELTVNLLENDIDQDEDDLVMSALAAVPENVSVIGWEPDGSVTMRADAAGVGMFSYALDDGTDTAEGRVRVLVTEAEGNRAPTAVRDDLVARAGVPAVVDLVANDIDPDGDVIAAINLEPDPDAPIAVELVDLHIARITAAPGFDNPVTVRYTASDGVAESPGVLVVRPYRDLGFDQPPQVEPDQVALRGGTATRLPVLDNDLDPEGEQLTLVDQDEQPFAEDVLAEDGRLYVYGGELRYEAPRTVESARTIRTTYSVSDPAGNVQSADVTIDLAPNDPAGNKAPTPPKLTARVFAGEEVAIPVPLVGLDPEGDPIAILGVVEPPEKGLVATVEDGFTYRSFRGTSGPDRFTFTVSDEFGGTATGTVSLIVIPRPLVNADPIAVPDEVRVRVGEEVAVPVLLNDRDPDDDELEILTGDVDGPTQPVEGEVDFDPDDGSRLVYAAPGSIDEDEREVSFSYGITDGRGGRARGVVKVLITRDEPENVRPVALDDFHKPVVAGERVSIDVLENDYDPDGERGDLVLTELDIPGVTVDPEGTIEVEVERSMAFRYQVVDQGGDGLPSWALVVIPVVEEGVPFCELQEAEVEAGESVDVSVLDGCTDPAGSDLRLVEVPRARGGKARLSGDDVTFEADPEVLGDAGFSFIVEAEGGRRAVGGVLVKVVGANFPPVLTSTEIQVSAGGTVDVDLQALVSDENTDDRHEFQLTGGTSEKIDASVEGTTLVVSASDDAKGATTQLGIEVTDGENTVEGVLPVQVLPHSKPPPVAVDDEEETNQGEPITVAVIANDDDPLGKGLAASMVTPPAGNMGTARVVEDGQAIEFTPRNDFFGTASFVYSVTDETGDPARTSRATVRVNVIGYPSAPAAPTGEIASKLVDLRWAAPAANGAPITGYIIERRVEGGSGTDRFTTSTASTNYRDTAVTNGTRYQYRVLAVNKAVDSSEDEQNWSQWSSSLQPDQVPDAPGAPTLEFGDRAVKVTWVEPRNDGSEIEEYEVRLSGGFGSSQTRKVQASTTELDWTGLTNGTLYTFSVRARNDAEANGGWGDYGPTTQESPAGAPLAVAGFTADRLDDNTAVGGAVSLTWSPPTDAQINADELDGYELVWRRGTATSGASEGSRTVAAGQSSERVYDLQNGQDYTFELRMVNKSPDTGAPAFSNTVTPAKVPDATAAPSPEPTADATGQAIRVTARLPANGGSGLTELQYQMVGGQFGSGGAWQNSGAGAGGAPGTEVSFTVGSLTNGTSYQVRTRACNDVDCGPDGALSGNVVPYGAPGSVGMNGPSVAGDTITWTWNQPSMNGGTFVAYEIRVDGSGGFSRHGGTSLSQTFGCGETHTLEVRAVNTGAVGEKTGTTASRSVSTSACRPTAARVVSDYYLGGTCAAADTSNGAWLNQASCPAGRWISNGTTIVLDCARQGAGYTVSFVGGSTQTWYWWMRIQGGPQAGLWVKAGPIYPSDGSQGLQGC